MCHAIIYVLPQPGQGTSYIQDYCEIKEEVLLTPQILSIMKSYIVSLCKLLIYDTQSNQVFLLIRLAIPEERDVISVNYVSPLVLRKELENLMENEGVGALESPDIIKEKQVIFWNMVSTIMNSAI